MSNSLFNLETYRVIMIDSMLEMNEIETELLRNPDSKDLWEAKDALNSVMSEIFNRYFQELIREHKKKG